MEDLELKAEILEDWTLSLIFNISFKSTNYTQFKLNNLATPNQQKSVVSSFPLGNSG